MRTVPPPTTRRQITLTKMSHVRAELAKLYGEARRGQVNIADASKLAHMLQILGRVITGDDLEQRLEALERASKERQT